MEMTENGVQDWTTVPRTAMYGKVVAALDSARIDAESVGNPSHACYLGDVLIPFVESELARLFLAKAGAVCVLMYPNGHPNGGPYTWSDAESEALLRVHLDVEDAKATADGAGLEVLVLTVDSLREHLTGDWAHVTSLVVSPAPEGRLHLDYELPRTAYLEA